jgi:hypothetical protein
MKIIERVETKVVTDVRCDICTGSAREDAGGLQFATAVSLSRYKFLNTASGLFLKL